MGIFFGWIIFSFVAGAVGDSRKIGFWGAFLLSLFLSPLIGLIFAFASPRKEPEMVKVINNSTADNEVSVGDEIIKLKKLLVEGVITQAEFDKQKTKLLA